MSPFAAARLPLPARLAGIAIGEADSAARRPGTAPRGGVRPFAFGSAACTALTVLQSWSVVPRHGGGG